MFDDKNLYTMEVSFRLGFKASSHKEDPMNVAKKYIEKLKSSIEGWETDWEDPERKKTIHNDNYVGSPMLLKVSIELDENYNKY